MVRDIVKDPLFLSQKSISANVSDLSVVTDLIDTILANSDKCVGLAANMIGVNKNIICILIGNIPYVMINSVITDKKHPYTTSEGCLSHAGARECIRYKEIKVKFLDTDFNYHSRVFRDYTAQIIQHELDHVAGVLI